MLQRPSFGGPSAGWDTCQEDFATVTRLVVAARYRLERPANRRPNEQLPARVRVRGGLRVQDAQLICLGPRAHLWTPTSASIWPRLPRIGPLKARHGDLSRSGRPSGTRTSRLSTGAPLTSCRSAARMPVDGVTAAFRRCVYPPPLGASERGGRPAVSPGLGSTSAVRLSVASVFAAVSHCASLSARRVWGVH